MLRSLVINPSVNTSVVSVLAKNAAEYATPAGVLAT